MSSLSPFAGAIAPLLLGAFAASRAREPRVARALAVAATALSMACSLAASAVMMGQGGDGGIDGISAAFVVFTGVLALVTLLGAPTDATTRARATRLLLTAASVETLFVVREPALIALFFAVSAIPTYVALRSQRGPSATARAFAVHHLVSALLCGVGLFAMQSHGLVSLGAFLVAIGVFARQGALPLHSWVPPLFEEAPLGSAAIFVHSQAGAYLLVRLVLSHPDLVPTLFLDVIGISTALYGALLCLAQSNAKRALGYLAVSQSALVLTGVADGGVSGVAGGILMALAIGLAQAGAAVALGAVQARRGHLQMNVRDAAPVSSSLSGSFLFLGLASVGLPGTIGFVAEDLVFHATLAHRPLVGLAMILTTALNGLAVLRIYFGLFGGGAGERKEAQGLLPRERFAFLGLAGLLVVLGVAPRGVMTTVEQAVVTHALALTTPGPDATPTLLSEAEPRADAR